MPRKRLLSNPDLILTRHPKRIPSLEERKFVVQRTNEAGYYLYEHYRIAPFQESEDISDEMVGEDIGWETTKVARYRRMLEKNHLIHFRREGKFHVVIVGFENVLTNTSGFPRKALEPATYRKLKKRFDVTDELSLEKAIPKMVAYCEQNPAEFL